METRGGVTSEDYLATARQVFEGCGMDSDGVVPVNTLMEKFAPYVPADKTEDLHCLLDPEQVNRSIGAVELASALEKYGERHNSKVEFDDSINLRNSNTPIDSDSGISADMGYQMLEEMQSELRDKRQAQRRWQHILEATERAHEDALSAITAERDSLKAHLQLMREENSALTRLRAECEESSERVQAAETALESRARELDGARKQLRVAHEAIDKLETQKAILEELLANSKEECHRINDMYAARQATLLEENENYKSNYADLNSRLQEQDEFLQQILKEKVLLEMEMSDVLNKSSRITQMERSFDVSCTDAQLLRALDSLNLDGSSRENLSQDEFYISDIKVERGRPSLFDELLRVDSFHRHLPDFDNKPNDEKTEKDEKDDSVLTQTDICEERTGSMAIRVDKSYDDCQSIGVQTDKSDVCQSIAVQTERCDDSRQNVAVQTEKYDYDCQNITATTNKCEDNSFSVDTTTDIYENRSCDVAVQTDASNNNTICRSEFKTNKDSKPCRDCTIKNKRIKELDRNISRSAATIKEMGRELTHYETNLTVLQSNFSSVEEKNRRNQSVIELLRKKVEILEGTLKARVLADKSIDTLCSETQTCDMTVDAATQADRDCVECEERSRAGNTVATRSSTVRNFMWDTLKGVLQLLAVLCLCAAILFLYNVSHYSYASRHCVRAGNVVPWPWMSFEDLFDLVFSVQYTGEIPM